jgi:hypothetical protein
MQRFALTLAATTIAWDRINMGATINPYQWIPQPARAHIEKELNRAVTSLTLDKQLRKFPSLMTDYSPWVLDTNYPDEEEPQGGRHDWGYLGSSALFTPKYHDWIMYQALGTMNG